MRLRSLVNISVFAVLLGSGLCRAQDESALKLWYRQPAGAWTQALPVGNGRLAAMVFGVLPGNTSNSTRTPSGRARSATGATSGTQTLPAAPSIQSISAPFSWTAHWSPAANGTLLSRRPSTSHGYDLANALQQWVATVTRALSFQTIGSERQLVRCSEMVQRPL